MSSDLTNFQNIHVSNDFLVTCLVHHLDKNQLQQKLSEKIASLRKVSDGIKRRKMLTKYQLLETYTKDNIPDNHKLYSIFLVNQSVEAIDLSSKQKSTLSEYQIHECQFWEDHYFQIDYLIDLFTNFELVDSLKVSKNKVVHWKLNQHKKKMIQEISFDRKTGSELLSLIQKLSQPCLISGEITKLKFLNSDDPKIIELITSNCHDSDLVTKYQHYQMSLKHQRLQECLDQMNLDSQVDKIKFGWEPVLESLNNFLLEIVFVHQEYQQKFKEQVDLSDKKFMTVVYIESVSKGDLGDTFLKQYSGIIGKSFY